MRNLTFPFSPGQAVTWLRFGSVYESVLFDAVVTAVHQERKRISIQIGGDPSRVVSASNVVHRCFCERCSVPGVVVADALRCPLCECDVDAVPPPDAWVILHWPVSFISSALLISRALRQGERSLNIDRYRELNSQINAERDAAFKQSINFYLDAFQRSKAPFNDMAFRDEIERKALLGDVAGVTALLKLRQQPDPVVATEDMELLDQFLGYFSLPVQLPPIVLPADDRTADGDDATTDWLRKQMERGERRRAA